MVPTAKAAPACSAAERARFFLKMDGPLPRSLQSSTVCTEERRCHGDWKGEGLKAPPYKLDLRMCPKHEVLVEAEQDLVVGRIIPLSAARGEQTGCRRVKQRIAGGKGAGGPASRRSPERRSGNSVAMSSLFLVLTGGEPRECASQNGAPKAARIELFSEFRSVRVSFWKDLLKK